MADLLEKTKQLKLEIRQYKGNLAQLAKPSSREAARKAEAKAKRLSDQAFCKAAREQMIPSEIRAMNQVLDLTLANNAVTGRVRALVLQMWGLLKRTDAKTMTFGKNI